MPSTHDELTELRHVASAFLTRACPESEVRRLMATDTGYDPAVWKRLATELGWLGLTVPERFGGSGFGIEELVVVVEEMGRVLLPAPFFGTVVLAAAALVDARDEDAATDYLPRIAAGELVATVALGPDGGVPDVVAAGGDHGWTLAGETPFVLDGHLAELILVPAHSDAGSYDEVSLFAVDAADATTAQLQRRSMPTMDETRKQAVLSFAGTPARLVGTIGGGARVAARVRDLAVVALAAEQVGGAARCTEMAVEYAKTRVQFDRPIGTFQAVKHKCADMLIATETARSALFQAVRDAAEGSVDLPISAATAKVIASQAYVSVAGENIHVHGGIGFTWEHPAHLYYKRAKSSEVLLGTLAGHRRRFAQLCGFAP